MGPPFHSYIPKLSPGRLPFHTVWLQLRILISLPQLLLLSDVLLLYHFLYLHVYEDLIGEGWGGLGPLFAQAFSVVLVAVTNKSPQSVDRGKDMTLEFPFETGVGSLGVHPGEVSHRVSTCHCVGPPFESCV